jgi:phosphate-selective porin OprO and OprP
MTTPRTRILAAARMANIARVSMIVAASVPGWAGSARGQDSPPTTAAPEASPGAPPAAVPVAPDVIPNPPDPAAPAVEAPPSVGPPPVPPEISARLDELDQLVRIGARKNELSQEEAAKLAKEAAVPTIDDKGASIRSGDGSTVLRFHGLLQVDGRFFLNDDALQDRDTFLIRRFRPAIDGTLFGLVDYRFVPDFAGGTAQVLDAYLDVHPWGWLRLRLGKMKAPIGLERLQSDADLAFIERALDSNLSTTRDIGVQVWGDAASGVVNYSIGVYNGGLDGSNADVDTNHAKDFIARLFFQPFKIQGLAELGSLGIGIAASTGNRKGLPQIGTTAAVPGLPVFRSAGQNNLFQYLAPASDPSGTGTTFAHLQARRLNPQLFYYAGPFGVLGEYILSLQEVQRGNAPTTTLTHHAAHATVTFSINGKEGYDGVTPVAPFDPVNGGWGALQLAVRWNWLKVDSRTFAADPDIAGSVSYADPLRSVRVAQGWAAGINYVPRRTFKLALDFEQTHFTGGVSSTQAGATVVTDRKTENLLIGRAQVNF